MRQAIGDLLRRRLVAGRRAAYCGRNERVAQPQPIVRPLRCRHVGKAGPVERGHQEVAGAAGPVAGEDASSAVRAVGGGRKADDEQPRQRIATPGYRLAPIHLFAVRAALLVCDVRAILPQARTALARDDLIADVRQFWHLSKTSHSAEAFALRYTLG